MGRVCTSMVNKALERGELEIYYQPQVDTQFDCFFGFEALLRWTHPKIGSINPRIFLSVVERTDSIIRIGDWIMRSACWQNKKWQDELNIKTPVSVNVSPYQLENSDILHSVISALETTGLQPEFLEIEITENVAIRNIKAVAEKLDALKNVGVKIAIDDFGAEYASFGYIKDLPVDIVKIDKSFIDEIGCNPKAEAILVTMVSLAKNLGIQLIAEGVETEKQLSFLTSIGCNVIQGFYCYKPMPADAVYKLLRKLG